MRACIPPVKRCVPLLAVAAGVLLAAARAPAAPAPDKQDRMVAEVVCELLQRGHLSHPEIGEAVSRHLFHRFLKDLDPAKLYFLQSDIDEFKTHETELASKLQEGNLDFPYAVYDRFLQRLGERVKLAEELVNAKQDFTVKEFIDTDGEKIPYAKNDDEMRERWRKRVKFDLLLQRLGKKPLPDAEARQKVLDRYKGALKRWKQVDHTDLLEIYLSDLTTSLDPHSTYMSSSTMDDFEIAMRLNLDGIGAVLRSENGQTVVVEVVPGGAADGHIKPNDKIVAVSQGDGKYVDVVDMKLRDVVKLIRGHRGTPVQLKVIPAGKIEPVVLDLTRKKIELKSQEARGDVVEQGKKADGTPYRIGVIDLPSFYADPGSGFGTRKSATEDVRRILKDFEGKHVDAVVLDLRRNGGGLLSEALGLTGLFIDQGPVVQVKDSQGRVQHKDDPEQGVAYGGPLVVLVSRFSASASEIVAGALQDYGRALLVGDTSTYGKGTVQTVIDLGDVLRGNHPKMGALKMTIQQFYRVNGDSTQNRGVLADVVLPSLSEALGSGEKEQDYALAFDHVPPLEHDDMGLVPAGVKAALRERSAKRVKESADFAKLTKEAARLKAEKERKTLPLNEKDLREEFGGDDADAVEKKLQELAGPDKSESKEYKFQRNFMNNEILQITEDFVQGKKLAAGR
ncbi:MAG TPA: carboxy terminal-processing peptidase [Gemmataceae bacterium]|nr:carboxy terminal-processing peptidase [Gemmataceae bacterium]